MNIATLRIQGDDLVLDQIVRQLDLTICTRWKQGAQGRRGVYESSGLNTSIADTKTPLEAKEAIVAFADKCNSLSINLSSPNISSELDIGLGVGYSEQFVASVSFSPSELQLLSAVGLALTVTAYPTSDEDGDI